MGIELVQLYKITHHPTNSEYYGIVYKRGKTYIDRYEEHMAGIGSKMISMMLDDGARRDEFDITLLEESLDLVHIQRMEVASIKLAKERGIPCLNMNGGGGFVGKKFFYNSEYAKRGWDVNIYDVRYNPTNTQIAIERRTTNLHNSRFYVGRKNSNKFSQYIKLAFDCKDFFILSGLDVVRVGRTLNRCGISRKMFASIINMRGVDPIRFYEYITSCSSKYVSRINHIYYKYISGQAHPVYEKHSIEDNRFMESMFYNRHANLKPYFIETYGNKINSPEMNDEWLASRERFKSRISSGKYTEAEINKKSRQSDIIKETWSNVPYADKINRTSGGLGVMNDKSHICVKCGKSGLTLGNLNRWHNDKCRMKE